MPEPVTPQASAPDYRCPYAVVEAMIRTIVRLAPEVRNEEEAWDEFIASRGAEERDYLGAIRRSRHSIFDYQQQQLYQFGIDRAEGHSPEEFCFACGEQFMRLFSLDKVRGFLRVLLGGRSGLQSVVADMVRDHVSRFAGDRYTITDEATPDDVRLTLDVRQPEVFRDYFKQHGIEPESCFRNSFHFISGAITKALSHVPSYDGEAASFSVSGLEGRMTLPVSGDARFGKGTLVQAVAGYIDRFVLGHEEKTHEDKEHETDLIVGSSVMQTVWDRIRRASRSNETLLLRGESGTGKSFLARKTHEFSSRTEGPFIEVGLLADVGSDNMIQSNLFGHEKGAFTGANEEKDGLFSLADGGTIFLDEIGDATPELQAKLLRVLEDSVFKRLGALEDRKVDVRVIAATNRNLEEMVEEGLFRQDLYYRLNVISIELPPLRERSDDVAPMAEFFLARASSGDDAMPMEFGPGLVDDLCAYPWPGNARELDHAVRHAVTMCESTVITRDDLPGHVQRFLERFEGGGLPEAAAAEAGDEGSAGKVIDQEALRRAIRSSAPLATGKSSSPSEIPAHFEYAKRVYLETLIDECGGDLALIARFWDRSSEKTMLKLVRDLGLEEELQVARVRARQSK